MKEENIKIGISGNTAGSCYFAIKAKGYDINITSGVFPEAPHDRIFQFDAIKGSLFFSASSPEELLGLIHMWELRGKNWQMSTEESNIYITEKINSPMYDVDGNLIEEEDTQF